MSFCLVLTSGAFTPGAADPFDLPPSPLEHAAVPSSSDDGPYVDLQGERGIGETGSAAEDTAISVAIDVGDIDPWAQAFAESTRLALIDPVRAPSYAVTVNQHVQFFLDRFTGERREVVDLWLGRAGRYLTMIRDTLRHHGLPEDLAFIAMIESGFNPLAVSRSGAKGLWQFMAGTARRYGLRVDQWVDERLDPEKSTMAAAAYLKDLHAQFGSWSLAQAAYNAGEVRISRAIRALGTTDFWALARSSLLRRETKEFVPQIHAATVIASDPGRFGFDLKNQSPAEPDFISVPPSTNLKKLSESAGISMETLRALNPVLVRGITPPGSPYYLRVPEGTGEDIQAALAIPQKAAAGTKSRMKIVTAGSRPDVHVVRPGDTISAIAKHYGVSVASILRWNGLSQEARLRPGDRVRLTELRLSADHRGQNAVR